MDLLGGWCLDITTSADGSGATTTTTGPTTTTTAPTTTTTAVTAPTFTHPTNGATGVTSAQAFACTAVPGADLYYLTVGTTPGGYDVVNSGSLPSSQTSFVVASLPSGAALHARAYARVGGSWHWSEISFTSG